MSFILGKCYRNCKRKNSNEPEYLQAVEESIKVTIKPVVDNHPSI